MRLRSLHGYWVHLMPRRSNAFCWIDVGLVNTVKRIVWCDRGGGRCCAPWWRDYGEQLAKAAVAGGRPRVGLVRWFAFCPGAGRSTLCLCHDAFASGRRRLSGSVSSNIIGLALVRICRAIPRYTASCARTRRWRVPDLAGKLMHRCCGPGRLRTVLMQRQAPVPPSRGICSCAPASCRRRYPQAGWTAHGA